MEFSSRVQMVCGTDMHSAYPGSFPSAVSYPSTSGGVRPPPGGHAVPFYAWRYDTPGGRLPRAEQAGKAGGAAWLPVGSPIITAIAPVFCSKADEYLHVLLSSIPKDIEK